MRVVIVAFKARRKMTEKEVRDFLPSDESLAEKGLELEKISVLEA